MWGAIIPAGGGILKGAIRKKARGKGKSKGGGRRRGGGGGGSVDLDMGRLLDLIDSVEPDAEAIIEEAAQAIRGDAMEAAPVETGALRGGMTVQPSGSATYRI